MSYFRWNGDAYRCRRGGDGLSIEDWFYQLERVRDHLMHVDEEDLEPICCFILPAQMPVCRECRIFAGSEVSARRPGVGGVSRGSGRACGTDLEPNRWLA